MPLPFPDPARSLRIANCSGFYGDRLAAMREQLSGPPVDVIGGDYLAELTMLILFRSKVKDPARGYATTFLRQLEDSFGLITDGGTRVVVNAGGLNPAGCAEAVRSLAERLGTPLEVAHVEGDNVLGIDGIPAGSVTANAYLGCWPIVSALTGGAQVVITGRCTDAALVCGPAAWWHGWDRSDFDALAGAVVAGHVLECGTQATGGNYSFFAEVPDLTHPGFPVAEIAADGTSIITKAPGSGGLVSVGTVTAQLLYEIDSPAYLGPDVTTHFDTITLAPAGPDRVQISAVRGDPPPPTLKVATNTLGGFRNATTFVLTGLDIEAKAALVRTTMAPALEGLETHWTFARVDTPDADTEQGASALLTVAVRSTDPAAVGRRFSAVPIEMALGSYPGFHVTAPPGEGTPYGVYSPAFLPRSAVTATVVHADGSREVVPHTPPGSWQHVGHPHNPHPLEPGTPSTRAPLGTIAGARSGDKGGNANVGVWVRGAAEYQWLQGFLTAERVRELLPETSMLPITVHPLPNLLAVNIVIVGLLGEGVASSTRFDPQAKGLGEWLRSRVVALPTEFAG